jgi:aryl-phospho-beta-D-glucosidase BglC (GH1 family)
MLCASIQAADFEKATDAVKNMGVGWNLGNTLDATNWEGKDGWNWSSIAEHEQYWGQPITKPELMKMMKEAGFGAIRVPVTWFQEMDKKGKVNAEWMKRVHEVVDYVLDNGMYCILNVHHDTGEHDTHWLVADEEVYNDSKDRFESLWIQIAHEFEEYDDHLIFEAYNEMLDKLNSWNYASSNASGNYDEAIAESAYKAINKYAQSFVDAVRSTGGNNSFRNLVVNTYCAAAGGVWGTNTHPQDPLNEMKLPVDAAENHLIFQVHWYPGLKKNNLSAIKSEVTNKMADLKSILAAKGAPVIIGEWGTLNDNSDDNYKNNKENYLNFCTHFVQEAKKNDIITFYWMGLSDGPDREVPVFTQPDLAETIVKAYRGKDYQGKYPSAGDVPMTYVVTYTEEWGELFLYGDWNRKSNQLSNYKGIRLEMEDDSYAGKVQVKIYGPKNGTNSDGSDKYIEQIAQLATGTNITTIDFDANILGSTFWGITLQTQAGTITAKIKDAKLIKADGTEEPASISVAWGCSLKKESSSTSIRTIQTVASKSDGAFYNLHGQRIAKPQKGIYIQNGKKVIMR